jgi:arsenite methyltransferase
MSIVSLDLDTEHLAARYDRVSVERQYRAGRRLIQELEIKQGESVLDIGAGTGLLAEYVASLVGPEGSVVGIDPLPLRIEIANRRTRPNLNFKTGNAYDLIDFSQYEFDVVYLNAVFHWLPEKRQPLRQIIRVLKSGGRLGISTGAKGNSNPLHLIKQRVLSRPPYSEYQEAKIPVTHRVSAEELASLLTEIGFKIAKFETRLSTRPQLSPEEVLQFSEASSFGNFLGHLPEKLRSLAREDIRRELEQAGKPETIVRGIVAVAIKP